MTPVVIDVHVRGAVAGLRGLGAAGHEPVALGRAWGDAGLWSRYAARRAVVRGADRHPARLGGALAALAGPAGGAVAPYPATEDGVDAVLAAARERPAVVAPFPREPTERLRRKSEVAAIAADAGLSGPAALRGTASELLASALAPVPCAVKSDGRGGALPTTRIVQTPDVLGRVLGSLPPDEPLLVQPRLRGPLMCVGIVVDADGRVASRFQHVTLDTWPASAGSSAWARSVRPDEQLIARAGGLLAGLGYRGLAQLDFMRGPDGPVLIDVNPRYYGSLALALAAGVNLPSAWHAVTVGAEPPRPGSYRTDVTYRWLAADVVALARGRPRRLWRRTQRPRAGAMWDRRDPLPGAILAAHAFGDRPLARVRALRGAKRSGAAAPP